MKSFTILVFMILTVASGATFALPAFATPVSAAPSFVDNTDKDDSLDQLIARAESARPEDRPGLYLEIARRKADAADKLYLAGNAEAGNDTLKDVLTFSKKATDSAIETGKKLKNTEIMLRKMAEKFRDIKRSVAFDDQAPIQQTIDELEKMRTELLSAMFGKKKNK
jgi:hypothetical protein